MVTPERRRPFRVSPELYPAEDHWLELGEPARRVRGTGRRAADRLPAALHYLDEGRGRAVLLLHGNPTWSFLYRDVIAELAGEFRCVAPDYPGFGFSDHPVGYGYTPREHARRVGMLVDSLDLDGFLVVGHDWGGPVGMAVSLARRRRVAGFVMSNTWCWSPDLRMRAFSWLVGGPPGRWLIRRRNLFARRLVPMGIHRREERSPEVLAAYRRPFPTPESRRGTWIFPREIRTSARWLAGMERRVASLRGRPVELVWGRRDPAFGRSRYPERWRELLPGAALEWVEDASHYLPEDRPERLVAAVRRAAGRLAT